MEVKRKNKKHHTRCGVCPSCIQHKIKYLPQYVLCKECNEMYSPYYIKHHLTTKKHKQNTKSL